MSKIQYSSPGTEARVPKEQIPLPAQVEDLRRFLRRECKLPARLEIHETLNANLSSVRTFDVIVRNFSRTGACFVFFQQLYPDDCISLDFAGLRRHYRVARCLRGQAGCFNIGVQICTDPAR